MHGTKLSNYKTIILVTSEAKCKTIHGQEIKVLTPK